MRYNGLLNIHKEAGWTSNDVVAKLRGILHQKKIGHTGTLDPDATGVLVVCLGRATKLVQVLTDHDKEYIAVCKLGMTTDTGDLSGKVLTSSDVQTDTAALKEVLQRFHGDYMQTPPMYSALKVNGKKLYTLAREGKTIDRTPRKVRIDAISLLDDSALISEHVFTMEVKCSKGTYIRTLCEDIGEALGCGGTMAHLTRTSVGSFRIENAYTIEEIQKAADKGTAEDMILPMDSIFRDLDRVIVKDTALSLLRNGNAFFPADTGDESVKDGAKVEKDTVPYADGEQVRVYDTEGTFYGIWRYDAQKKKFMTELFLYG